MGLLDIIYARAGSLNPVSPPVGRYPHMMRDTETTMAMTERLLSFSGDDYSIINSENQETLMSVKGKVFSFHDRKNGNMLYNMSDKKLSTGEAFVVEDAKGMDVLSIKKKWSLGSKLVAYLLQDGDERQITLSGDFWGGSANIKDWEGRALAHIARDVVNVNEAAADQQTNEEEKNE
ncbi:hypothetical protein CC85DRAFT_298567 [Cutaneotrichosporon oleaginosum]|uniref:Uncharacterized protein n=1 Tax=Cutaneotrichosporon oleaginosum TaxID=879819 RepID=A0A0J0XZ71_9TREE|nr:uncharacterized protein CC85DRAFT_298567 [Cutaneotrichosporon oleaginosum]KLT46365.1 hypothetical protein CC85DRAFT_298567 [Cutaneotrichosporon oleaginosum]